MIGIYIIENKLNGKVYIGQSTNVQERINEHKATAYNKNKDTYEYPLYVDMRAFGLDSFACGMIEECTPSELISRESYWITEYNSTNPNEGYNQAQNKITEQVLEAIIYDLENTQLLLKEIAVKYSLHPNTISKINNGVTHILPYKDYPIRPTGESGATNKTDSCIDCGAPIERKSTRCKKCYDFFSRKVVRPDKDTLLQEVIENGFSATGRKYGVSDNAVRKWMVVYGLPRKASEIKHLYGDPKNPLKKRSAYNQITLSKSDQEITFASSKEAAQWLIKNGYTTAKETTVQGSVTRVITGKRHTYLGFKITGKVDQIDV